MNPLFQHRHYVRIAAIIAKLDARHYIAHEFAKALEGTNPNFDSERFYNAAIGAPDTGRDRVR
jgi:hypothetical protein